MRYSKRFYSMPQKVRKMEVSWQVHDLTGNPTLNMKMD